MTTNGSQRGREAAGGLMALTSARSNVFRSALRRDSRSLSSAARVFSEIERELLRRGFALRFVGTVEL